MTEQNTDDGKPAETGKEQVTTTLLKLFKANPQVFVSKKENNSNEQPK